MEIKNPTEILNTPLEKFQVVQREDVGSFQDVLHTIGVDVIMC